MEISKIKSIVFSVFSILIILYILSTFARNTVWATNRSLSIDILKKNGSSEKALCALAEDTLKKRGPGDALYLLYDEKYGIIKKSALFYFTAGKMYYFNQDYINSERCFTQVVNNARLMSGSYLYRGRIRLRQGDLAGAEVFLGKAVDCYKYNGEALHEIAKIYYTQDKMYKAADNLMKIVFFIDDNFEVNRLLALTLYNIAKKKKFDGDPSTAKFTFLDAITALEKCIETDLADTKLKLFYLDVLIEAEYLEKAKDYLDKIYREGPENIVIITKYAFYCQHFMLYRKAEELFTKLNKLTGGTDPDVLFWAGGIHYKRRHLKKAEEFFKQSLVLFNRNKKREKEVAVLNNLALIDFYIGDYKEAEKNYFEAIEKDSSFWQAYAGLSEVYIREREFEKATKYLEKAKELAPSTSYFALIKLEGLIKKKEKFENDLKRYRDQRPDG